MNPLHRKAGKKYNKKGKKWELCEFIYCEKMDVFSSRLRFVDDLPIDSVLVKKKDFKNIIEDLMLINAGLEPKHFRVEFQEPESAFDFDDEIDSHELLQARKELEAFAKMNPLEKMNYALKMAEEEEEYEIARTINNGIESHKNNKND